MKTKKEYCVHIYPEKSYEEMEGIYATTPEEAEEIAMKKFSKGDYSFVGEVEVMVVCHCEADWSTDNDINNSECDNCGKKL